MHTAQCEQGRCVFACMSVNTCARVSQSVSQSVSQCVCVCEKVHLPHHGVAGEWVLQLEDLVEAGRLRLHQLLLGHLDHEAHSGVGVVLLVVCDQSGNLVCARHHGLQHVLLVGLGPVG